MKFIRALLDEAKTNEMDPSQVTASDVSSYVRQVKASLKGKEMTKSAVASAVRDCAEDCPKFGGNTKAIPKLVAAVCAKLCGPAVVKEATDADMADAALIKAQRKAEKASKAAIQESADEEDEDPDVKKAEEEIKRRKIKMMSPRAEAALGKRLGKADKNDEDKSSKIAEGWDSDSEEDEDPDVKKAEEEVKRRKIKMLSPRAEAALNKKLSKADKSDEDKSSKKVDESVDAPVVEKPAPVVGSFLAALLKDAGK